MTERWFALAILGSLGGCGKDKDGDSQAPECMTQLTETVPAAESHDAYYRAAIEATFDDHDATASITLDDASGRDVPGTVTRNDDDTIAYFEPDAPLTPGASYTAKVTWCEDASSEFVQFTTSSLGDPLDDPSAVEGRTYLVDLGDGRFAEPAGVGPLLQTQVRQSILLTVTSVDATSLTMVGALTAESGSTQDFCLPTIDFPEPADFTQAPYWEVQADEAILNVADNDVSIQNLVISATFSTDGTTFGGGVLGGTIDTSLLGALVGSEDEHYICDLAEDFGDECSECPNGNETCLGLLLDQLVGDSAATVAVRPIDQRECDAECPLSKQNPKCEKYYVPPK